ncbi:hypothetical protein H5410_021738 [Solanum commersonii]|uniref:Uncharacterized protein n=1 Tax=Solanum commersonii TaxID=4109 RepID=A0A9J5ZC64_SOLCO|nr:hypothetical protein H5410_021738 [Solanum commersonii]
MDVGRASNIILEFQHVIRLEGFRSLTTSLPWYSVLVGPSFSKGTHQVGEVIGATGALYSRVGLTGIESEVNQKVGFATPFSVRASNTSRVYLSPGCKSCESYEFMEVASQVLREYEVGRAANGMYSLGQTSHVGHYGASGVGSHVMVAMGVARYATMLEIVTRPQHSLLDVVLILVEIEKANQRVLRTKLRVIKVAMIVKSWTTSLENTQASKGRCFKYALFGCNFFVYPVGSCFVCFGVFMSIWLISFRSGSTRSCCFDLEKWLSNSPCLYLDSPFMLLCWSFVAMLIPLSPVHDLESERWCSLVISGCSPVGKWKLAKKIHLQDGVMLAWFIMGLVPLGHCRPTDYDDTPLASLISLGWGVSLTFMVEEQFMGSWYRCFKSSFGWSRSLERESVLPCYSEESHPLD